MFEDPLLGLGPLFLEHFLLGFFHVEVLPPLGHPIPIGPLMSHGSAFAAIFQRSLGPQGLVFRLSITKNLRYT